MVAIDIEAASADGHFSRSIAFKSAMSSGSQADNRAVETHRVFPSMSDSNHEIDTMETSDAHFSLSKRHNFPNETSSPKRKLRSNEDKAGNPIFRQFVEFCREIDLSFDPDLLTENTPQLIKAFLFYRCESNELSNLGYFCYGKSNVDQMQEGLNSFYSQKAECRNEAFAFRDNEWSGNPLISPLVEQYVSDLRSRTNDIPEPSKIPAERIPICMITENDLKAVFSFVEGFPTVENRMIYLLMLTAFLGVCLVEEALQVSMDHVQISLQLDSSSVKIKNGQRLLKVFRHDSRPWLCYTNALMHWLRVRGTSPGYVFLNVDRDTTTTFQPPTLTATLSIISNVLATVNRTGKEYTSHSFRQGGVNFLIREGWTPSQILAYVGDDPSWTMDEIVGSMGMEIKSSPRDTQTPQLKFIQSGNSSPESPKKTKIEEKLEKSHGKFNPNYDQGFIDRLLDYRKSCNRGRPSLRCGTLVEKGVLIDPSQICLNCRQGYTKQKCFELDRRSQLLIQADAALSKTKREVTIRRR